MRYIDIIKNKIYSEIVKPSHFTMCSILNISSVTGIGLILNVVPISASQKDGDNIFSVVCVNRPERQFEHGIKEHYNALVLNVANDRPNMSACLLVPKTMVDLTSDIDPNTLEEIESKKTDNIKSSKGI